MTFEYSFNSAVASEERNQVGCTSEAPYIPSMAFPSPRTWKASRHTDFSSSSEYSSGSEEDGGSDAGAEIAEWMAHSCIREDEELDTPNTADSPPPPPALAPLHLTHLAAIRTRPVSRTLPAKSHAVPSCLSWSSSGCSSEASVSVTGSPTSGLGQAESAAWDVLFAAAGEVQKMARERDAEHGCSGHMSVQQLLLNRNAASPNRGGSSKTCAGVPSNLRRSSNGVDSPPRSKRNSFSGSPPTRRDNRSDSGHQAVLRGTGSPLAKDSPTGTGVFLPQVAPTSAGAAEQSSKKAARQTTVILPPHLVQALGLNVDGDNNVVFSGKGSGSANQKRTGGSKSVCAMKMAEAPTRSQKSPPKKAVAVQPRSTSTRQYPPAVARTATLPAHADLSAAWTY